MNIVFAVVLALVSLAHAAVFFNETANRNTSKVNLTQNSFGGGHGGSFFYPGSPGFAKWSHGRNEDKGSGLPHGHQHTVRPPPPGIDCDFCAPNSTDGPEIPMSEVMKQSKLAWARYDNRKTTLAPAKDGPSCVDHHSAKYCAKMREIHACQNAEVREECAKTCGVCTASALPKFASVTSTPTTPWPANFGLATRRPKCFDHVNDCARAKDALRCAEGDYPDICAKTCGFCTEPASATNSESETSS